MKLQDILQHGEGKSLSRQHLSIQLGVCDRTVRRRVHRLRLNGMAICGTSDNLGYYLAETQAEKKHFLSETNKRIIELQAVYDAVDKAEI